MTLAEEISTQPSMNCFAIISHHLGRSIMKRSKLKQGKIKMYNLRRKRVPGSITGQEDKNFKEKSDAK